MAELPHTGVCGGLQEFGHAFSVPEGSVSLSPSEFFFRMLLLLLLPVCLALALLTDISWLRCRVAVHFGGSGEFGDAFPGP